MQFCQKPKLLWFTCAETETETESPVSAKNETETTRQARGQFQLSIAPKPLKRFGRNRNLLQNLPPKLEVLNHTKTAFTASFGADSETGTEIRFILVVAIVSINMIQYRKIPKILLSLII